MSMSMLNKLKQRNERRNPLSVMGITLGVMYLISGMMLLLLAVLLYQFDLSEEAVRIGVVAIYITTGFAGGFFIGRQLKDKKYLWGLLAGGIYFIILFVLSLVIRYGSDEAVLFDAARILTTVVLCAVSGMAGGMVS